MLMIIMKTEKERSKILKENKRRGERDRYGKSMTEEGTGRVFIEK